MPEGPTFSDGPVEKPRRRGPEKADADRPPCPEGCDGESHPKCKGHNGQGQWCGKAPIAGGRVCPTHGGAAPQVKAAAAARVHEEAQRLAAEKWAPHSPMSPGQALLEEVSRSAGIVAWLEARISVSSFLPGEAATPELLEWFQKERDHLRKVCGDALRAGVEERRVRIAESQAAQLVTVIRGVLRDLDLTTEQQAKIPEVVPRHLRLLAGGAA